MNAAGGTLLTPLTLGQPPLPAMTDDRHADALGVTRKERRQEYQGTGGRDEEAPAPEGAEAPRRHETANPRIRGEDTALRAVISIHDSRPKDSRSDAGAGAHGSEYRRGRLRASSGKAGSLPEGGGLRAPGLRLA